MRVALMCDGTRGDLQPFLGLIPALAARGHAVFMSTNKNLRPFIDPLREKGQLEDALYTPIDYSDILVSRELLSNPLRAGDVFAFTMGLTKVLGEHALISTPVVLEALRHFRPGVIVSGSTSFCYALSIAEKLAVPVLHANYIPLGISRHVWPMIVGAPPEGTMTCARVIAAGLAAAVGGGVIGAVVAAAAAPSCVNWAVGKFMKNMSMNSLYPSFCEVRRTLDLHHISQSAMQQLFHSETSYTACYSRWLVGNVVIDGQVGQGYWYTPEWEVAEAMERSGNADTAAQASQWVELRTLNAVDKFVSAARDRSRKVVSLGWGSMLVLTTEHLSTLALASAAIADVSLILVGGWSGVSKNEIVHAGAQNINEKPSHSEKRIASMVSEANAVLEARSPGLTLASWAKDSNNVLEVSEISHAFLYRRVDAAVHHGGSGTTAATARSGVPAVITPVLGDQAGWAFFLKRAGSAVRSRHITKLSANELARHISRATSSSDMKRAAQILRERVVAEPGVRAAVKKIESRLY